MAAPASAPLRLHPAAGPRRYRVGELRLASNLRLPGLVREREASRPPDVAVELRPMGAWWHPVVARATAPWRSHPVVDEAGRPLVQARRSPCGSWYHLVYADGSEFAIDARARWIRGAWPRGHTRDDAVTYLAGPVLAFARRLRGSQSLHASAVEVDGRAVAFLGRSGSGKSTLAAAFALRGVPVLCDDAAALSAGAPPTRVEPGPPRVRLWPDSVAALLGTPERLPRLTPSWDKRFLDLSRPPGRHAAGARPLALLYLLGPRTQALDAPLFEPVPAREAFVALLSHSYGGHFQDGAMRAQEFRRLAQLAERVPVRRLRLPADPGRLDACCEAIATDQRSHAATEV